jgi:hypothetical protein
MESVLTTTNIKTTRMLFRIESAFLILGGVFGAFNVNLVIKWLIGHEAYTSFNVDPLASKELSAIHPFIQFFFMLVIILGVAIFYVAQAAIDPALKRISFIYIFLYLIGVGILYNASKINNVHTSPTFTLQALVVVFTLFLLFHTYEVLTIFQRRVMRKFS